MSSDGSVRANEAVALISAVNRRRRASGSIWGAARPGLRCRAGHQAAADPARRRRLVRPEPGPCGAAVKVSHTGGRAQQRGHRLGSGCHGVGTRKRPETPRSREMPPARQPLAPPGSCRCRWSHHITTPPRPRTAGSTMALRHRHLPVPTEQASPPRGKPTPCRDPIATSLAHLHWLIGALDGQRLGVPFRTAVFSTSWAVGLTKHHPVRPERRTPSSAHTRPWWPIAV